MRLAILSLEYLQSINANVHKTDINNFAIPIYNLFTVLSDKYGSEV